MSQELVRFLLHRDSSARVPPADIKKYKAAVAAGLLSHYQFDKESGQVLPWFTPEGTQALREQAALEP